ncbi:DUF2922 domain-containing protein [Clostridium sp. NSJ-49]|uniref:Protein of uncharacterized function (DUF2922) n=1 Tax=Clostridium disporicum TaxID=84024 RepID=A0A173XLM4_9CLOT|nr:MULTISPECIES: DUF2922 domain-containing protein [Clostridium]MBC5627032.1 DUF2922 domain-containing protein [Clostridium sp. NSJ-49]MDU6339865.1 DUF2922 domain-containing protein [Clostridium sp.]CUN52801.1 Protein of uncharacterised function (DUF2922) [Clostridium disporicum]
MEYTLSMTFLTETDDKYTLSISGVRQNLNSQEVSDLMDIILENDIFISKKGAIASKYAAKVTERQITKFTV